MFRKSLMAISVFTMAGLSGQGLIANACPCQEVKHLEGAAADKANYNAEVGLKFLDSDAYKKEFSDAIASARTACEKHKGEPNVAVVSDIDETLLDNSPDYKEHPTYTWQQRQEWVMSGKSPTLRQTADFLAWARKNGYAVFLITGRNEGKRASTIENLIRDGVAYDGLYMRQDGDKRGAEEVKAPLREAIGKMGFKVIVNIGDQVSDLTGGFAEDCEKLPNKFYLVP